MLLAEIVLTRPLGVLVGRELMKYWSRVSSNRWLVVKMLGVLFIFFLLWVLVN